MRLQEAYSGFLKVEWTSYERRRAMTTRFNVPFEELQPARPPVVLLGGINLVRTLGLAGIPAIVVTDDPAEPALASRYCTGRVVLPPFDTPEAGAALAELGARLAEALGRPVPLMCGGDGALDLVYAHRARLQQNFLLLLSDPAVAHALIAKDRFQAFGRELGLPLPPELEWEGDGAGTVRGTAGPVVVKPRAKADWHDSLLCQRLFGGDAKALIFASGAEAAATPGVDRFAHQLTFQEFIPGDDADHWSYHGFADESGEVMTAFVGRKLRTFPPPAGESSFIEVAYDESLAALGRDIARRCPLKGAFKMDFKRDPRDGRWYLLEINARFSLWQYLAAANGLNMMADAYDFLVGGRRPVERPCPTRYRWLALGLDWRAHRDLAAQGRLTTRAWLGSILGSRNVYNVFSWRDPGPWLRFWSQRVARRALRGPAHLATLLRQWRSTAS